VAEDEEIQHEEGQSLEADADLQGVLHEVHQVGSLLHHFKNTEELGQLDELVHPANPCKPHDLVEVASVEDDIKRYDGQAIDQEPRFQVGAGDHLPVFYQLVLVVEVGCIERYQNVNEEQAIDS